MHGIVNDCINAIRAELYYFFPELKPEQQAKKLENNLTAEAQPDSKLNLQKPEGISDAIEFLESGNDDGRYNLAIALLEDASLETEPPETED